MQENYLWLMRPDLHAASEWSRGSDLPLGVLASVQAYTTDAASRYQGRAHSPDCAHRGPQRGVGRHDEMVTVEELLGNKGFDPCGKCGGYGAPPHRPPGRLLPCRAPTARPRAAHPHNSSAPDSRCGEACADSR